jgi:hypothetical protein
MTRNAIWLILVVTVVVLSGCGGGSDNQPTNRCVLTGTLRDYSTNSVIVGATVKVGTYTTTSSSQGTFRLDMPTVPVVETYSVDGRSATPLPGFFDFWARADGNTYNAKCIPLPVVPLGETSLGTIYLMNADSPPPFPPSCP